MAYFSIQLSRKTATKNFSFGYHRAEILAAVVNGVMLFVITIYIFYESYIRFMSPQSIKTTEMLIISIIGLLANLYIIVKLRKDEKQNLNIKGAYLHVLGDALSSVGVIIAGILIIVTGNYVFDPIISIVIGIIILMNSLQLIRESCHILMEA